MYGCECENDLSLLVDDSQIDALTNLEQLQLLVEVRYYDTFKYRYIF